MGKNGQIIELKDKVGINYRRCSKPFFNKAFYSFFIFKWLRTLIYKLSNITI